MSIISNITGNLTNQVSNLGAGIGAGVKSAGTLIINQELSNFLFAGPQQSKKIFDPVWKLTKYTVSDQNTPPGDVNKTTADDFAGSDHPKYKFNYTLSFDFRNTIKTGIFNSANSIGDAIASTGSDIMAGVAFGLKTASRPNPSVIYQDVNFYNYRTKVATKVDFGTITVVFYDDVNNRVHDIFAAYLKSISPIANIANGDIATDFDFLGTSPEVFAVDVSSLTALDNNEKAGLIKSLTITQHLPLQYQTINNSEGNTIQNVIHPAVQYIFFNPKILNMTLDDLDMTANDVSTASMTFTYDSVYMNKISTTQTGLETITVVPTRSQINTLLNNPFVKSVTNELQAVASGTAKSTINRII